MKREIDMTHGSLFDKIVIFAIPLALSSALQQLFNSADIAVVGRFAGREALAAVGANGPLINLIINIFVGLSVGSNVVIARLRGQRNDEGTARAVHTSIVLSLLSGVFLLFVGVFLAPGMLTVMKTPADVIDGAKIYLQIYFLGMPFMMLYNFEAAILRSKGDTKRPLITLLVAGVVNLLLNLLLVIVFHLGVAGVAIATSLSNVVSSLILLWLLIHEEGPYKVRFKDLCFDGKLVKEIAAIGIPSGIQGMVFSLSNIVIQTSVNSLGSSAVAASTASVNGDCYVFFFINAFSQAATTFIGQNYGAGEYERCKKIARYCVIAGTIISLSLGLIICLFSRPFISIFTSDPEVAELAIARLFIILPFQFINAINETLSGCMRGMGKSMIPAVICMFGVVGTRFIWIFTIYPLRQTYQFLHAVYPISWFITMIGIIIAYLIVSKQKLTSIR